MRHVLLGPDEGEVQGLPLILFVLQVAVGSAQDAQYLLTILLLQSRHILVLLPSQRVLDIILLHQPPQSVRCLLHLLLGVFLQPCSVEKVLQPLIVLLPLLFDKIYELNLAVVIYAVRLGIYVVLHTLEVRVELLVMAIVDHVDDVPLVDRVQLRLEAVWLLVALEFWLVGGGLVGGGLNFSDGVFVYFLGRSLAAGSAFRFLLQRRRQQGRGVGGIFGS